MGIGSTGSISLGTFLYATVAPLQAFLSLSGNLRAEQGMDLQRETHNHIHFPEQGLLLGCSQTLYIKNSPSHLAIKTSSDLLATDWYIWAASIRSNVMESPTTQLPEGTSRILLHPGQRGAASADSGLAHHCSCAQCSAPRTSSLVRLTPSWLYLGSFAFRQAGALQNQMGTNTGIFMRLSRQRR